MSAYDGSHPFLSQSTRSSGDPSTLTLRRNGKRSTSDGVIDTPQEYIEEALDEMEENAEKAARTIHSWFEDWSEFLATTGVASFGIGVVLGGVYSGLMNSFINDILIPPLALLFGDSLNDFFIILMPGRNGPPYDSLADARADGAITENYGRFLFRLISAIIVTIVLAYIIGAFVRFQRAFSEEESNYKVCFQCTRPIPLEARRCNFCTSYMKGMEPLDEAEPAGGSSSNSMTASKQQTAKPIESIS
ncbi:hypothetical protein M427DRAFT_153825 [Gonapodya prolifera JEL478]|uniref:Gated mechanosensitive channel n=1 Tax=Gonapodya prolifera (strain JEL478) TaxID=1344416 RepID=A0A139AKJ1_GONPJ|nr:hypothetical protein M427DRAFT_153825 [Gonapodya prolifera JEL478]|eukprot:KXS17287.1 hypothetical protein M427DRAFT_153825 [Gonapodya prolifera JEL478]